MSQRAYSKRIVVGTSFIGMHAWPDAPPPVAFLRHTHRHVFHVTASMLVGHNDRELEFFIVQTWLINYLRAFPYDLGAKSCEMIAQQVADALADEYGSDRMPEVSVSEDNENGAIVRLLVG